VLPGKPRHIFPLNATDASSHIINAFIIIATTATSSVRELLSVKELLNMAAQQITQGALE
jgi:hypothetical protein